MISKESFCRVEEEKCFILILFESFEILDINYFEGIFKREKYYSNGAKMASGFF